MNPPFFFLTPTSACLEPVHRPVGLNCFTRLFPFAAFFDLRIHPVYAPSDHRTANTVLFSARLSQIGPAIPSYHDMYSKLDDRGITS